MNLMTWILFTLLALPPLSSFAGENAVSEIEIDWQMHRDDFRERGAPAEMPWHFHTGQGEWKAEIRGADGQIARRLRSDCELSEQDTDCREKVYFFSEAEVRQFIQAAVEVYESDLQTHEMGIALSSAIVAWSGKTFWAGLVAPDPTIVTSKLVAIGSGVVAGAMALVTAWEGKRIYEIHETLAQIDEVLRLERIYVDRCGHNSRNFLDKMAQLGVRFHFFENAYDLIPGTAYLETLENERDLVLETKMYARAQRISYGRAYAEIFEQRCGHLALARNRAASRLHPWTLP